MSKLVAFTAGVGGLNIKPATKPVWFRYRSPKWLSKYQFFTCICPNWNGKARNKFSLTEPNSGLKIGPMNRTRNGAKRVAKSLILKAGRYQMKKSVSNNRVSKATVRASLTASNSPTT